MTTSLQRKLLAKIDAERSLDRRPIDNARADILLKRLFPAQRAFVDDPSRHKAALCPRRSGKSYAVLVYLITTCLRKPHANCLCIGVTRGNVKGVYWQTLKQLGQEFELGLHYQNTELICSFPNGSQITFSGADTGAEIEKFRGQGYDLVCVDECKSYSRHMFDEMIIEVLEPALSDRLGTLVLVGTPGAVLAGPFYEITTAQPSRRVRIYAERDQHDGPFLWSLHRWHSRDNVLCPWIWESVQELKQQAGWGDDHPGWQREYLGQWVADSDALVFEFSRSADCSIDELPDDHEWQLLLGAHISSDDSIAYVLGAWSTTHPALHFVHAEKRASFKLSDLVADSKRLQLQHGEIMQTIVSGAGDDLIASLATDHGFFCEKPPKSPLVDRVRMCNSDFAAGKIMVKKGIPLADELSHAQWGDPDRKMIDQNCPHNAVTAALNVLLYSRHHLTLPKHTPPRKGTPEWYAELERAEEKHMQQSRKDEEWWKAIPLDRSNIWRGY